MNTYLFFKWLHILSSVVLVGTGFGTAFYMFFALRTRNVQVISEVARLVVRADTWFTAPAVIAQPVTGYFIMQAVGYSFDAFWIQAALLLYVFAGLCWLPVLWLQLQLKYLASQAVIDKVELPPQFWRYAKYWELLGYPAFVAMLTIFWLMVYRPY